jgi:hypothetical protein
MVDCIMNEDHRVRMESAATDQLIEYVGREQGDLPARVVAGALMRASVQLAIELMGPEKGPEAARNALETVLSDYEPRSIQ